VPNIEAKSRCRDFASVRRQVARLGGRHKGVERQLDTYFFFPRGRLKLRETPRGAYLIPYLRPDAAGPKRSDYALLPVPEPRQLKSLLSSMLGVEAVVDKRREIWLIGNVRVHLDRVRGLGSFLELEAVYVRPSRERAERARVARLLRELDVRPSELLRGSYRELSRRARR